MSEAIVHTIPGESNINEEVHTAVDHLRMFISRNRDVLIVLTGLAVSQYLVRSMFRRELTRLRFNVEVFPYEALTSTEYEYDAD